MQYLTDQAEQSEIITLPISIDSYYKVCPFLVFLCMHNYTYRFIIKFASHHTCGGCLVGILVLSLISLESFEFFF